MQFVEAQQNEVQALQSIFMDDFDLHYDEPGAWNQRPSPRFTITLRPSSEFETNITLELMITMNPSYPHSLPKIEIKSDNALGRRHLETLRKEIDETMTALKGHEMVFEVTSNCQALLDEYARMEQEGISLDQDRTLRIQRHQALLKEKDEERQRQNEQNLVKAEEELEALFLEEIEKDNPGSTSKIQLLPESVVDATFERLIVWRTGSGREVKFHQVVGKTPISFNFFGTSVLVKPVLEPNVEANDLFLTLTKIDLKGQSWATSDGRSRLQALQKELQVSREFRHHNVLPLLDFTIQKAKNGDGWSVFLLFPTTTINSVSSVLELVHTVSTKVARAWCIQILEALEALNRAGLVHKMLSAQCLLLDKIKDTGETRLLVAHPSYGYTFSQLDKENLLGIPSTPQDIEANWLAPELARSEPSRKSDVWQFGVILIQMLCGTECTREHVDPVSFIKGYKWLASLEAFYSEIFTTDPRKRNVPMELLTSQFLRDREEDEISPVIQSENSVRARSFSTGEKQVNSSFSRYTTDFDEGVILGRGGFGQVVKARNKLDGRIYAIKKVQATRKTLSGILQEVVLLSRLNHQNVVRYYTVWLEEDQRPYLESSKTDTANTSVSCTTQSSVSSTSTLEPSAVNSQLFTYSLSDLGFQTSGDLLSDSNIEFEKSDFENTDNSNPESTDSSNPEHTGDSNTDDIHSNLGSNVQSACINVQKLSQSTLYIQMEYCENHTLADLIKDGLSTKTADYWRLMRQLLEALAYIHSEGVIHRDLKPTNIFIDETRNIKIGDFGLAKSIVPHVYKSKKASSEPETTIPPSDPRPDIEELTTAIGTSLYVAVEVCRGGSYDEKVDMYSLGIIIFEMVFAMETEMERIVTIRNLRSEEIIFPHNFKTKRYTNERQIVSSLLDHDPEKRPSAAELLSSGSFPLHEGEITIKEALKTLDSTSVQQLCSTLFRRPLVPAHQVLYDRQQNPTLPSVRELLIRREVLDRFRGVFELHGAIESSNFRPSIFPRSTLSKSAPIFELLDSQGNLLQLPHDLTLPLARRIAQAPPAQSKSFYLGNVFRPDPKNSGKHPLTLNELVFDIVTLDSSDLIAQDAETIRVMVDALASLSCFESKNACIYVNHCDILESVLEFCGITPAQYLAALTLLGDAGVGPARSSTRRNLLASSTLSSASLDILEQFGFRDSVEKAQERLETIMDSLSPIWSSLSYLKGVIECARKLGVSKPIYLAPLSSYKPKFYEKGVMFQYVLEPSSTGSSRIILGAGGRYDALVRAFRLGTLDKNTPLAHGVGFSLAVDRVLGYVCSIPPSTLRDLNLLRPRCDVFVATFSESTLYPSCMRLLGQLWNNNISADYIHEARSSEELAKIAGKSEVKFIVIVKQSHNNNETKGARPFRLRKLSTKSDEDMSFDELISNLNMELSNHSRQRFAPLVEPAVSGGTESPVVDAEELRDSSSSRVIAFHEHSKARSRKSKLLVEEKSHEALQSYIAQVASAPIIALDLRDDVLNAICTVSPHSNDDWRRKVAGLAPNQKAYIMSTQSRLATEANKHKLIVLYSCKTENIFIYETGPQS